MFNSTICCWKSWKQLQFCSTLDLIFTFKIIGSNYRGLKGRLRCSALNESSNFSLNIKYLLCVYNVWVLSAVPQCTCRDQRTTQWSAPFLPLCGSWGSNSGHQSWQQASCPYHWPLTPTLFFKNIFLEAGKMAQELREKNYKIFKNIFRVYF